MTIEYRVREVTRYIITRSEQSESTGGVTERGEYGNAATAYEVAYALAAAEAERLGLSPGDMGMIYPAVPDGVSVLRTTVAVSAHYPGGSGGVKTDAVEPVVA